MEYLEGETLARRQVGGLLPIERVSRYALEIACALLPCAQTAPGRMETPA
jgi:hypothetical protein